VANFWATRSHTLRSEAEDEFKSLCLEFPQFGFDILSKSLLLKRYNHERVDATNILQRVYWTTSSRESATKRCTLHLAVFASVHATAAVVCNKVEKNQGFPCTAILRFFFGRGFWHSMHVFCLIYLRRCWVPFTALYLYDEAAWMRCCYWIICSPGAIRLLGRIWIWACNCGSGEGQQMLLD
jgi:hypothetical protein